MRIKKIVRGIGGAVVAGGALAAGIYYVATREPVAIKVDPRLYDDYAGYYDFGNRYVIHVRREGERLMCYAPERAPRERFLLARRPGSLRRICRLESRRAGVNEMQCAGHY